MGADPSELYKQIHSLYRGYPVGYLIVWRNSAVKFEVSNAPLQTNTANSDPKCIYRQMRGNVINQNEQKVSSHWAVSLARSLLH